MERRGTPTLATNFKRRRGEERERERTKKGRRDTRSNEICISPWARRYEIGIGRERWGTIPRKQVARTEVTCQKIPSSSSPFLLCPPNAQVIDRVVSAKDFSPRSRPWYLRSLLSLVFVFSLSKGTAQLSTRSAYTESRVDNRDKIQWRLSHP